MAAVATNIANGDGPAYVICALPYRADVNRGSEWGLDTALAIVEEAVEAFDPQRIEAKPVRTSWPAHLQDKAKVFDVFDLMRSAYFGRATNSLPDLKEPVPRIEADFFTWLSCRKEQWRKHRNNKRARRQLTPEEDFPRWLKQRKWHWKASKMERESQNTPPLEEDFFRWLSERKKVWRLQRLTRRHSDGRGLLSVREKKDHRRRTSDSVGLSTGSNSGVSRSGSVATVGGASGSNSSSGVGEGAPTVGAGGSGGSSRSSVASTGGGNGGGTGSAGASANGSQGATMRPLEAGA